MSDPKDSDPNDAIADVFEIPIEESIDLHWFRPRETRDVVEGYLEAAIEKGFREVRIIHGRGRGVQRNQVRRVLESHPCVERFEDAPGDRGGWGVTLAWLRPSPTVPDDALE